MAWNMLKTLGFMRGSNKKKKEERTKKSGQEFADVGDYGESLNELEQVANTNYMSSEGLNAIVNHQLFIRDFEGMLGLTGKEKNGKKIGVVLAALKPYNQDNFLNGVENVEDLEKKFRTAITAIQQTCNDYVDKTSPWSPYGKRRRTHVDGLANALIGDENVLDDIIYKSRITSINFMKDTMDQAKEEGGITGNDLLARLKLAAERAQKSDGEDDEKLNEYERTLGKNGVNGFEI